MSHDDRYDFIIIGSGAGGGTLALKLAPSGKRILILERGDYLPREKQNWDPTEVFVKNRYVSQDAWYDSAGKPFQPGVHYFVGGATKMFGAAMFRLRQHDFTAHRTADGMTPDWPIRYEDLEPYYTQAERLYHVHGKRGDEPHRSAGERAVRVPAGEPRAAHSGDRGRLEARGLSAGVRAVRRDARRGGPSPQPLHPLQFL
jgi:choline dehydrogenase-like flavoprotein